MIIKPPGAVGMLCSRVRRDERALFDAFAVRGFTCAQIDTRRMSSAASLADASVDFAVVLNREVGLARAVYGASVFEAQGIRVANSAVATRTCGDKWETTRSLREAKLPVPETVLALTSDAALDAGERLGWPVVIKPLNGSWGRRVGRLNDRETATLVFEHIAALPAPSAHIIYLQELITDIEADLRLLVVGDQVVGACKRTGPGLRKNVALGSRAQKFSPGTDIRKIAVGAAQAVNADVAGVDILLSRSRGPLVLEVNAGVEFGGLQSAWGSALDVAGAIIDHVISLAAA